MNHLSRILPAGNVVLDMLATSKKRAFEQAGLLFENNNGLARALVFDSLFARERLGSTALGQGVAVPHGRVKGLEQALAAFIRLAQPITFDAPEASANTLPMSDAPAMSPTLRDMFNMPEPTPRCCASTWRRSRTRR